MSDATSLLVEKQAIVPFHTNAMYTYVHTGFQGAEQRLAARLHCNNSPQTKPPLKFLSSHIHCKIHNMTRGECNLQSSYIKQRAGISINNKYIQFPQRN